MTMGIFLLLGQVLGSVVLLFCRKTNCLNSVESFAAGLFFISSSSWMTVSWCAILSSSVSCEAIIFGKLDDRNRERDVVRNWFNGSHKQFSGHCSSRSGKTLPRPFDSVASREQHTGRMHQTMPGYREEHYKATVSWIILQIFGRI